MEQVIALTDVCNTLLKIAVKAAVTGSGRAGKAQVTAMVTRILGLEVAPRPADAADALALAICHAWRGAQLARLDALAAAQGRR